MRGTRGMKVMQEFTFVLHRCTKGMGVMKESKDAYDGCIYMKKKCGVIYMITKSCKKKALPKNNC